MKDEEGIDARACLSSSFIVHHSSFAFLTVTVRVVSAILLARPPWGAFFAFDSAGR
jgi:hypothetical protein